VDRGHRLDQEPVRLMSVDASAFLREHVWAVLATGRRDGSPQQSMVGYVVDDDGRIVISAKSYTAKWHNARRQPRVSLTMPDGRAHLVVYGEAECIDADPLRAELPAMPATFTKFPSSLNGPFGDVALPADTVDWEVELVVVIGAEAHRVAAADAWSYVAGLTVGQDISERTTQMAAGRQFSLGKSFPGFAPTGPWLVTTDELDDPDDLALGCSVDGETVQDARTNDLIFPVSALVERLSAIVTLYPGDLIFTGTPSGVGVARRPPRFLAAGNVLETWIEGIGRLRNHITKGS
jgi:PPOX class probable F420-dependent enzyme